MLKDLRLDFNDCVSSQVRAFGLSSRYDANETAVFARELEYLEAQAVEKKFPEMKGLTLLPIVGGSISPATRSHTWREVEGFGEAAMLEGESPEDFPTADVRGSEQTGRFRKIGAKYIVSVDELRARPSMSIDPEQRKAEIARKAIEAKLDKLVAYGGGPFKGLVDTTMSVDDSSSDDWSSATTATVIAAAEATFRRVAANMFSDTNGLFADADFFVTTKMWIKLDLVVPATTAGTAMTLRDWILKTVRGVRSISHWNRLDAQGASGADLLLAFPRSSEVGDLLIPIRYESQAPQLRGYTFETYSRAMYGGIRQFHPKAFRRVNIDVTP